MAEIALEEVLKYTVIAIIAVAVILFIVKYSDSTFIFQNFYARDMALLEDSVSAAGGNTVITYDNVKEKDFTFNFFQNIVGVKSQEEIEREIAEVGERQEISYSLGKIESLSYSEASFESPKILFFSKKGNVVSVSEEAIDISFEEKITEEECYIQQKKFSDGKFWVEGIAEEIMNVESKEEADLIIIAKKEDKIKISSSPDEDSLYISCLIQRGIEIQKKDAKIELSSLTLVSKPTIEVIFTEEVEREVAAAVRAAISKYNE